MIHYKKPAFWIVLVAVVTCVVVAVCFLISPKLTPAVPEELAEQPENASPEETPKANIPLLVKQSEEPGLYFLTDESFRKACGFDVYVYGLETVQVETEQGIQDLKTLLQDNPLTAEMLINDARRQATLGEVETDTYKDGGSQIFRFGNYSLIKANSLEGNRNLYITAPGYDLNDVEPDLLGRITADVTGDGEEEIIQLWQLTATGDYTLDVLNPDRSLAWREDFGWPHVEWNTLFLYTGEDGHCLLRYNPYISTGLGFYSYTLFRPENRQEVIKDQQVVEFDLNGRQAFDVPEMVSFAEKIRTLLKDSVLLFSTDYALVGDKVPFAETPGDQFLDVYDFLDDFEVEFSDGDDLATRLQKFSDFMMSEGLY